MKRLILLFLTVFICLDLSGQGKKRDQDVEIISHEVQLGESVRLISKKYLVDPAEIYKLNKFAVDGISQGMVLKIPVPKKEESVQETASNSGPSEPSNGETPVLIERTSDLHTIIPKETLYSIAKKYGVTVDGIKTLNPELENGVMKVGQIIKIPPQALIVSNDSTKDTSVQTTTPVQTNKPSAVETPSTNTPVQTNKSSAVGTPSTNSQQNSEVITHVVIAKETLYSLSKKYNVTIDDIKQQNQALLNKGLQIGQTLTIRKN